MGHRVVGRYRIGMARGTMFTPEVPRLSPEALNNKSARLTPSA